MKKLIILLLFVWLVSISCDAQTAERKYEYAIVHLWSNEIKIFYGNKKEEDFNAIKNLDLKGYAWKNASSLVDALNYMDGQGYELASALAGSGNYYQYTFKREIKK